mmetsp:Transcript_134367/g.388945  ORF Transcript_134367/g.388945 Transcript_134367/m.388945 type:complete len:259 (-) Transcript_134367:184-960(-)
MLALRMRFHHRRWRLHFMCRKMGDWRQQRVGANNWDELTPRAPTPIRTTRGDGIIEVVVVAVVIVVLLLVVRPGLLVVGTPVAEGVPLETQFAHIVGGRMQHGPPSILARPDMRCPHGPSADVTHDRRLVDQRLQLASWRRQRSSLADEGDDPVLDTATRQVGTANALRQRRCRDTGVAATAIILEELANRVAAFWRRRRCANYARARLGGITVGLRMSSRCELLAMLLQQPYLQRPCLLVQAPSPVVLFGFQQVGRA